MSSQHAVPIKIYPRLTTGRFNNARVFMVLATQLAFFGLPWLQWNGRQAVHLDLEQHRFLIFGLTFWPQDFIYFAALLVICALGLFLWTALAGRLWCGYSCPQTVYTQIMIWIERLTLGDHNARRKLDAAPMSVNKFTRKTLSHSLMGLFSLLTGFTLVGYFTPVRELAAAAQPGLRPVGKFLDPVLRRLHLAAGRRAARKVCLHMCPYARFQGAMFDNDTLIISYDNRRGEPRGKGKRPTRRAAAASIAASACRSAPPASTSATACNMNA